jgi:diacylglycerol kinase family enzyme
MIGVIVNPNAHLVRRRPDLAARLRHQLGAFGEVVETRTADEAAQAARGFAARGVDVVATCGGDGTNLSTLTALVAAYGRERLPAISILRGGTVNTIAENLRIRGTPEALLDRLIARVRARDLSYLGQDSIQVSGGSGDAPRFGFLFAAAMGARFLEAYYSGRAPGPAWAGALALRTAASCLVNGPFARRLFSRVPVTLTVDGRVTDQVPAPRLLVASTVPDVGLGMKVAWQAGRQPGRLHLIASNLSTVKMALQLHRVLGGRPLDGAPHLDVLARSVRLRFETLQPYTLDGELYRERELALEVGPRVWIVR